jgi:hypothetical protein
VGCWSGGRRQARGGRPGFGGLVMVTENTHTYVRGKREERGIKIFF